jgi:hypothetical protein
MTGESVLAEFEAMIGRGTSHDASATTVREITARIPQRRAVNWANALAKIADEIQQRQGRRQAETVLRTVGARIARDLLGTLPESRDAFEPAINRAFSSLDWGWVAITERDETIRFEHRAPWPFENRTTHLPAVLEGFFSDTLQRLAGETAIEVRTVGKRGGALIFEWRPPQKSEPAASADDETAPLFDADLIAAQPETALEPVPLTVDEGEPSLAVDLVPADAEPAGAPAFEMPRTELGPDPTPLHERRATRVAAHGNQPTSAILVGVIVFLGLFGLGLFTNGGDFAGRMLDRLAHVVGISAGADEAPSGLEGRARAGDTNAEIDLALGLAGGADPDYAAAAGWFQNAATAGSAEAQYDLGVLFEQGLGVKHDPVEAAILFMRAAATGHPMAQYRLGLAYENGFGVARDGANAANWYERAARQGIRPAQTALGRLLASGTGVAADPVSAYAWDRLAEENGDSDARDQLTPLWAGMTIAQRASARRQALVLIGDVGTRDATPAASRPSIDQVLDQAS